MPEHRQIVGILFADVLGYSSLPEDGQMLTVQSHLKSFADLHVAQSGCIYKNTWGDAIVVLCGDPNDSLELALQLREWFRNVNWQRKGVAKSVQLRIGLHSQSVSLVKEGGIVTDIAGRHVNLAARIEPVVSPGCIYCSEAFQILVKDSVSGFVRFTDLGIRELAKDFGPMKLFEVTRTDEATTQRSSTEQVAFGASIPKIKKNYSDAEKDDFLEKGFSFICDYIPKAARLLEESDPDVKATIRMTSATRLTCEFFVKGQKKARGQIWLSNDLYSHGINYSDNISSVDGSYNESIRVETDGFVLSLRASMSLSTSGKTAMSYQEAASMLWKRLTHQLQY